MCARTMSVEPRDEEKQKNGLHDAPLAEFPCARRIFRSNRTLGSLIARSFEMRLAHQNAKRDTIIKGQHRGSVDMAG